MIDERIEISRIIERLFPLNRSVCGEENRKTLNIIKEIIPIDILSLSCGSTVFDWKIPMEWKIKDAWIKNKSGKKIIRLSDNNLHVISHSESISKKVTFEEIKQHIYYIENNPKAIPYRTSYYKKDWGFCVSFEQFQNLFTDSEYEVFIDSEFYEGELNIGELFIKGESKREYLISTYFCHPSLANDNLSGVVMTAFLAKHLLNRNLKYSYRIVFIPETIGALSLIKIRERKLKNTEAAIIPTCVGGPGGFSYKQSFEKDHYINDLAEQVLKKHDTDFLVYPFDIHGSDERQYSAPDLRLNCISICRDKYYEYSEYHTSLDNMDFISTENINKSLNVYLELIDEIEKLDFYKKTSEYGENMLSKHSLYPDTGGAILPDGSMDELSILLWILFYSDGKTPVCSISKNTSLKMDIISKYIEMLEKKSLLEKCN